MISQQLDLKKKSNIRSSHGTFGQEAQENPDLPPHPDAGTDGCDRPEVSLKLPAEMTFFTLALLHLLHCTSFAASSLEVVRISKMLPQSLHLYSYIGITVAPMLLL
jgi:hypothetical protein